MEITEPTAVPGVLLPTGFPELTPLGKRIEMLRIERGLSKQHLARYAGTSRQQLWRVMTGKSELTSTLGQRLADALQIELRALRGLDGTGTFSSATATASTSSASATATLGPATLSELVSDPTWLERAVGALPSDEPGRRIRLALLDAVHAAANEAALILPPAYHELRARALAG